MLSELKDAASLKHFSPGFFTPWHTSQNQGGTAARTQQTCCRDFLSLLSLRIRTAWRTLVCDNCDMDITYVFCRDRHLILMFSGLLQIDLFKGKWSLAKSYFKQNYCHACHKRFAFFFPLPLSSLLFCHGNCGSKLVK